MNEELALSLFEFSERYVISDLRRLCEKYISKNLRWDNSFKIYETACFYESDALIYSTLIFFQRNIQALVQREGFEDLPKSTYLLLKRIQWNDQFVFDSSFVEEMAEVLDLRRPRSKIDRRLIRRILLKHK